MLISISEGGCIDDIHGTLLRMLLLRYCIQLDRVPTVVSQLFVYVRWPPAGVSDSRRVFLEHPSCCRCDPGSVGVTFIWALR